MVFGSAAAIIAAPTSESLLWLRLQPTSKLNKSLFTQPIPKLNPTHHTAHSRQKARASNSLQGSHLALWQRLEDLRRTHVRNLVDIETATQQHTKHIAFTHTMVPVIPPLPNTPHCAQNRHNRQHAGANHSLQLSHRSVRQPISNCLGSDIIERHVGHAATRSNNFIVIT